MAETVQFDLVSPERLLVSVAAREVRIPGAEGDLTAMEGHAPLITTLRPGLIRVTTEKDTQDYVVTGGFAEINGESVSVLAERAVRREDMTQDSFKSMIDEASDRISRLQKAETDEAGIVDNAAKLLADMVAVGDEIGLPSK